MLWNADFFRRCAWFFGALRALSKAQCFTKFFSLSLRRCAWGFGALSCLLALARLVLWNADCTDASQTRMVADFFRRCAWGFGALSCLLALARLVLWNADFTDASQARMVADFFRRCAWGFGALRALSMIQCFTKFLSAALGV